MPSPCPSTSAATSATRASRSGKGEDILTELSRFQRLFVIARHTSFTYKGRSVDVKKVARELGVHFVLEGSVRI